MQMTPSGDSQLNRLLRRLQNEFCDRGSNQRDGPYGRQLTQELWVKRGRGKRAGDAEGLWLLLGLALAPHTPP